MRTIQLIIIGIGVLIGILLFNKTKPIFLKFVLSGLIISFGLTFFPQQIITNISFWLFGILSLIFSIYSGLNKKWLNFIIGFFAFLTFLWGILYWPFFGELQFLMIIPVICYIMICKNWKENISQLSILTILGLFEFSLIFRLIASWLI